MLSMILPQKFLMYFRAERYPIICIRKAVVFMPWTLKTTKEKVKCSYKTLYISDDLIEKIGSIAKENDTSFNNVVISMIESCLNEKSVKGRKKKG